MLSLNLPYNFDRYQRPKICCLFECFGLWESFICSCVVHSSAPVGPLCSVSGLCLGDWLFSFVVFDSATNRRIASNHTVSLFFRIFGLSLQVGQYTGCPKTPQKLLKMIYYSHLNALALLKN